MNIIGVLVSIGVVMKLLGVPMRHIPAQTSAWIVIPLMVLVLFSDVWHFWIAPKWFAGTSWFEHKDH